MEYDESKDSSLFSVYVALTYIPVGGTADRGCDEERPDGFLGFNYFSVYVAHTNIPEGELLTGFAMRSERSERGIRVILSICAGFLFLQQTGHGTGAH